MCDMNLLQITVKQASTCLGGSGRINSQERNDIFQGESTIYLGVMMMSLYHKIESIEREKEPGSGWKKVGVREDPSHLLWAMVADEAAWL